MELRPPTDTAEEPVVPRCDDCVFGLTYDDGTAMERIVICHRFPQAVPKAPDDWCGEFQPR